MNVINGGYRMEDIPLPEGCDGTDVSWHGSRPECQGVCAASSAPAGYDDYDLNSAENAPAGLRKFMIVILGNGTAAGSVVRADVQVYALHLDHAETLGEWLIAVMGGSGQLDSVCELG